MQRSRAAGIVAAIAALMLVYAVAIPALAQSPGASGSPTMSAAASVRPSVAATTAASPGGAQPSPSQPDTAIGDPGAETGGSTPIWFLLLGIGAVAAVLVYMGMRGSELKKAPVGTERDRS